MADMTPGELLEALSADTTKQLSTFKEELKTELEATMDQIVQKTMAAAQAAQRAEEQPQVELEQPEEPEPEAPDAAPEGEAATPHDVNPTLKDRRRAGRIIERYYPQELKNQRVEGTVEVWVYVDAEGKVQDSRVNTSSGDERLDNAALRAARELEFNPAQNRGDPVRVWVSVPITFSVR